MHRAVIASLVVCGLASSSVAFGQGLDKSQGKAIVQFTRAMKEDRSKKEIEFSAADDADYVVEVDATGFQPTMKIIRGDKKDAQVLAVGRKAGAGRVRADLVSPPVGNLRVQIGGETAYPTGAYRITVIEIAKKK
jgi:hypothetical protein